MYTYVWIPAACAAGIPADTCVLTTCVSMRCWYPHIRIHTYTYTYIHLWIPAAHACAGWIVPAHLHLDTYLERMLELNRIPELHHHIPTRRTHQQQRKGEQEANSLEASVAHARACGCIRRACSRKPPPAPPASRCTFRLLSWRALPRVSALSNACRRDAAYVSIRQHTSAYVSIYQQACRASSRFPTHADEML
jgi:hypothetical protein